MFPVSTRNLSAPASYQFFPLQLCHTQAFLSLSPSTLPDPFLICPSANHLHSLPQLHQSWLLQPSSAQPPFHRNLPSWSTGLSPSPLNPLQCSQETRYLVDEVEMQELLKLYTVQQWDNVTWRLLSKGGFFSCPTVTLWSHRKDVMNYIRSLIFNEVYMTTERWIFCTDTSWYW